MNQPSTFARLLAVIRSMAGTTDGEISRQTPLAHVAPDSLDQADLSAGLEREFGLMVPGHHLETLLRADVAALVGYLDMRIQAPGAAR